MILLPQSLEWITDLYHHTTPEGQSFSYERKKNKENLGVLLWDSETHPAGVGLGCMFLSIHQEHLGSPTSPWFSNVSHGHPAPSRANLGTLTTSLPHSPGFCCFFTLPWFSLFSQPPCTLDWWIDLIFLAQISVHSRAFGVILPFPLPLLSTGEDASTST
jgi:hypothetical protein